MGDNFIGIGGQKCATSWLYACLFEHPEVCAPIKEVHFFSRERNFSKGHQWYRNIFIKGEDKICGEISTSYLYSLEAPYRIRLYNPNTKFILIVRDPVDRSFSHYMNDLMGGKAEKNKSFIHVLSEKHEYIDNSLYGKHFSNFLKYFDLSKFLIIDYKDIITDPHDVIINVYKFLSINDSFIPWALNKRINNSKNPKFPAVDNFILKISDLFVRMKLYKLRWLLKRSGIPDFFRNRNSMPLPIPPDSYTKSIIFDKYFKDDVDLFEKISSHKIYLND